MDDDAVHLKDVYCMGATAKAILCLIEGDEVWIPQSQITADSEVWKREQRGTLVITGWIARKKGLASAAPGRR